MNTLSTADADLIKATLCHAVENDVVPAAVSGDRDLQSLAADLVASFRAVNQAASESTQ